MTHSFFHLDSYSTNTRRLVFLNAVAVVFDALFLGASLWVFIEIAQTMVATVDWYYLLLSFALPVAIPLYAVLERVLRGGCLPHLQQTQNAVAHAYSRSRHALIAAFWNSFGVSTFVFWMPFYVDARDKPERLTAAAVWQYGLTQPSALFFGIVYVITVGWNMVLQYVYNRRAEFELQTLCAESPYPTPCSTMDESDLHQMRDQIRANTSPRHSLTNRHSAAAAPPASTYEVELTDRSTRPPVPAMSHKKARKSAKAKKEHNRFAEAHATSSSAVEASLDHSCRSANGDYKNWQ